MKANKINSSCLNTVKLHNQILSIEVQLSPGFDPDNAQKIAAVNLLEIANFLTEIAERLKVFQKSQDGNELAQLFYTVPYYAEILPGLMKEQLDACHAELLREAAARHEKPQTEKQKYRS